MNRGKKQKFYTYQLNMIILNILAIFLFIVVSSIVFLIERHDIYVMTFELPILFLILFLWLGIHEVLHAIGFLLFKSVKKENITFGVCLERGVFYCMCKQEIGKKIILTSLLFPFLIIGIITLAIGMIINQYELVFLSIMNIVASIGDLVMVFYFLMVPNDVIYLDLDDCTSFTVLSFNSLDNIKIPGIKLLKTGIYDKDKMAAKDRRKLVVSKLSYIILFLLLCLFIITIIKMGGKI